LNDNIARLVGQWLSERLGKPFITENRPGSGGNIAVEAVVNAPPDGYTLLMVSTPNAVNATSDTPIRNITPVAERRSAGCTRTRPPRPGIPLSASKQLLTAIMSSVAISVLAG
jgi:hypothetical protein